jgi:hypothetical protein
MSGLDRGSAEASKAAPREAVRDDDQSLHEQPVRGVRAFYLYPGHAVRALPMGSQNYERKRQFFGASFGDARRGGNEQPQESGLS